MGIREVTYYIAFCDCCKEDADYGDYSAWGDRGDAVSRAEHAFEQFGDEMLCPACWCWPEDLPDYPGDEAWQGTDDAVKRPNCHPANSDQSGEHKPDWSDWGLDHPEEEAGCTCGYNGTFTECAESRTNQSDGVMKIKHAEDGSVICPRCGAWGNMPCATVRGNNCRARNLAELESVRPNQSVRGDE